MSESSPSSRGIHSISLSSSSSSSFCAGPSFCARTAALEDEPADEEKARYHSLTASAFSLSGWAWAERGACSVPEERTKVGVGYCLLDDEVGAFQGSYGSME